MATSSQSKLYSRSQLQAYGWRAFCVEFLCGIVVIAWYFIFLAETVTLRGLTRLEKFAARPPDDFSRCGRANLALCQDDWPYPELMNATDHARAREFPIDIEEPMQECTEKQMQRILDRLHRFCPGLLLVLSFQTGLDRSSYVKRF